MIIVITMRQTAAYGAENTSSEREVNDEVVVRRDLTKKVTGWRRLIQQRELERQHGLEWRQELERMREQEQAQGRGLEWHMGQGKGEERQQFEQPDGPEPVLVPVLELELVVVLVMEWERELERNRERELVRERVRLRVLQLWLEQELDLELIQEWWRFQVRDLGQVLPKLKRGQFQDWRHKLELKQERERAQLQELELAQKMELIREWEREQVREQELEGERELEWVLGQLLGQVLEDIHILTQIPLVLAWELAQHWTHKKESKLQKLLPDANTVTLSGKLGTLARTVPNR